MPIATGEVFAWPEGLLIVYASASGNTSGSGVGFAANARLSLSYGWLEYRAAGGAYRREITGQRADLSIGALFGDTQLFRLLDSTAALNAEFQASAGKLTQSARIVLYSGVGDSQDITQAQGQLFQGTWNFHSNAWSAFGQ